MHKDIYHLTAKEGDIFVDGDRTAQRRVNIGFRFIEQHKMNSAVATASPQPKMPEKKSINKALKQQHKCIPCKQLMSEQAISYKISHVKQ